MRFWTLGFTLLLLAPSLWAQGTPVISSMSLPELEKCGALAVTIRNNRINLAAQDRQLAASGQAIRTQSNGLDATRRTVNVRDAKQVAAFNARLAANHRAVAAYEAAVTARNAGARASSLPHNEFNLLCADRPYDLTLLAKLPAEQIAAMKDGSAKMTVPTIVTEPEPESAGAAAASVNGSTNLVGPAAKTVAPLHDVGAVTRRAEAGEAEAQYMLGTALLFNSGLPLDPVKGLGWLEKAAAQGHPGALFSLSEIYRQGIGVEIDETRRLTWLRRAAAAGSADGQHNLALWYESRGDRKDATEAFAWMTKAAMQGQPDSQFILAEFYSSGVGTSRSGDAAMPWLRKSAAQGFRPALLKLGENYERGAGVMKDPVEALKYYLLAGDSNAKANAARGCMRLIMLESATHHSAEVAIDRVKHGLKPSDIDRASALADSWVPTTLAAAVKGC